MAFSTGMSLLTIGSSPSFRDNLFMWHDFTTDNGDHTYNSTNNPSDVTTRLTCSVTTDSRVAGFIGTGQKTIPTSAASSSNTGSFWGTSVPCGQTCTVSMWLYFSPHAMYGWNDFANIVELLGIGGGGSGIGLSLKNGSNPSTKALSVTIGTASSNIIDFFINTGTWYNVTIRATRTSSTTSTYAVFVNNSNVGQVGASSSSGSYFGSYCKTQNFATAQAATGCYFMIDSLGIWNRALSDSDIGLLYNSGAGRQWSNLPA